MRETLSITKFIRGLITNVDSKDIPSDAGSTGTQNLDPNDNGKLSGASLYSVVGAATAIANGRNFGFIERNDGKYDLVSANNGDTKIVTDFYEVVGANSTTDTSADSSKCVMISREEAHVGCGTGNKARWSGYIRHNQFSVGPLTSGSLVTGTEYTIVLFVSGDDFANVGGTNVTGNTFTATGTTPTTWSNSSQLRATLTHANADCVNNFLPKASAANGDCYIDTVAGVGGTTDNAFFETGTTFWYALVPVYDGFQEAPFVDYGLFYPSPFNGALEKYAGVPTHEYVNIDVFVKNGATSINKRISAFNLYRSQSDSGFADRGSHTLIETIDINATWLSSGSDKHIVVRDYGETGVTFERNSGLPESIYTTDVKYTISCEINNFHFVGDCLHDNLTSDDGAHLLFRSKAFRYDTFDWTADFLRLPFVPKALAGYNGRVYAFTNNKIARINPEGFYVEDIYEGAGCESQQGVVVTEFGMFFANSQDCYSLINGDISIISTPIKNNWQSDSSGNTVAITYDGQTNQVVFGILSSSGGKAYCYHTPLKRWDFLSLLLPNDTPTGLFSGKDGESHTAGPASADGGIYQNFGHANERAWTWISPEYDFNDPSQKKMFDKVEVDDSTGTSTVTFGVDGATPTTAIASLSHNRNKSIQIKIIGSTGSTGDVTDSMSIVHRTMVGKR